LDWARYYSIEEAFRFGRDYTLAFVKPLPRGMVTACQDAKPTLPPLPNAGKYFADALTEAHLVED